MHEGEDTADHPDLGSFSSSPSSHGSAVCADTAPWVSREKPGETSWEDPARLRICEPRLHAVYSPCAADGRTHCLCAEMVSESMAGVL